MKKIITYITISLFFSGCISLFGPKINYESIKVHGETKADRVLQLDILKSISYNLETRKCLAVKNTFTEVIKVYSAKPNAYKIKERWTAFGCEKEFGYYVMLEGGEGKGTKYTITPIK
ncbi:MAG: hypothetical protein P8Y43_03200 [Sulfurovaceae bacterium]|jgi:hypothetical protein